GRKPVYYRGTEIEQIRPAWCITVHKFQGSQCKRVVFVMAKEHQIMVNRELVYTAITRGEEMVFLLGSARMLELAPQRSAIRKRYTNLTGLIQQ
ncbi:ATP-binding domain-containing protein, partial [Clostridium perfringens]|nr:ATP-binding domain-containing protein [Clostridium perfringens]